MSEKVENLKTTIVIHALNFLVIFMTWEYVEYQMKKTYHPVPIPVNKDAHVILCNTKNQIRSDKQTLNSLTKERIINA